MMTRSFYLILLSAIGIAVFLFGWVILSVSNMTPPAENEMEFKTEVHDRLATENEKAYYEMQKHKEEVIAQEQQSKPSNLLQTEIDQNNTSYTASGLTKDGGVNWFKGVRETWYSSKKARHYRINEWHLDNEGFWRDSNNYYVVAMQLPEGTTMQGSKGTCIVLDYCETPGTRDYYTCW